jgi:enoyl-CoA hydratase
MEQHMDLLLDKDSSGVWTLRLNQPSRLNALSDAMGQDLHRMLADIDQGSDCKVLVLTGEGRGFCAGFDLALADDAPGSEHGEAAAWTRRQESFAGLVTRLKSMRLPVIAAVNGPANGAGFGLALGCDLRMASTAASFNAAFIKVGMSSCDIGVSYLLPRSVGTANAFDIMLTGRMVGADEALRIGLVSRLSAPASLLADAHALGLQIAAHDDFAVWMTKRGMWANLEAPSLHAALELENRTQILARTTGVLKAKAEAFKRRQA